MFTCSREREWRAKIIICERDQKQRWLQLKQAWQLTFAFCNQSRLSEDNDLRYWPQVWSCGSDTCKERVAYPWTSLRITFHIYIARASLHGSPGESPCHVPRSSSPDAQEERQTTGLWPHAVCTGARRESCLPLNLSYNYFPHPCPIWLPTSAEWTGWDDWSTCEWLSVCSRDSLIL